MGLKNCVYCTTPISEHATVCPNPECKRDYPFDGERKSRITAGFAEDRALKEVEAKVYTQAYLCPECGKTFLTRDALRCGHTRPTAACPSCGYPRFYIKCHRCEKQADGYDARQQVFVCYQHTIERCVACGMLIHDTSINCHYSSGYKCSTTPGWYHENCPAGEGMWRKVFIALVVIGFVIWLL